SNPGSLEYQLTLYRILDPSVNPENAIDNRVVEKIWESDYVSQTSLVYSTGQPALEAGQKYAFRIHARDAAGKDNFKNNGYSQAGWFYFGYPAGGNIALTSPPNGKSFTKNEFRRFQWEGPDDAKTGQQVSYHLKIVKINEGQDSATAIASNPAWEEYTTGQLPARYGGDVMLDRDPEPLQDYAWQVTAFTGEQKVAESAVYKFTGPPLIDWFWAGNHKVSVTRTFNSDLNNLSGKGKTAISETGEQIEFTFDSLQIEDAGGEYVLRKGNMYVSLSGFNPVELHPGLSDNGNAAFYASAMRLNKDELAIKGVVKWDFPLATASPKLMQVVSESQWLNYDTYTLLGSISLGNENKFDLIDPAGYRLEFNNLSNFLISDNKYQLRLFGNILLPGNIRNSERQRMAIPFRNADNLFYFSQQDVRTPDNIELIPNTGIQLKPLDYVVDFSENKTPGKVSADPAWMGIYISHFIVDLKKNIDQGGQLSLDYELQPEIMLSTADNYQCFINSRGLTLRTDLPLNEFNKAVYNTFPTEINKLTIDIDDNEVKDTYFGGSVKIPVLKGSEGLQYMIPLNSEGIGLSNIGKLLEGEKVIFNADKDNLKVEVTIKKAVFKDKERLELVADLDWPAIQAFTGNISGLCVWGNEKFGFNLPDGKKALTRQISAKYYNTYDLTIDSVMAGKSGNNYLIGVCGLINLSDDISGKDDAPPRVSLASFQTVENVSSRYDMGSTGWVYNYIRLDRDFSSPKEIFANLPYIRINTPVIQFEGGLVAENNHPVWGTAFYGLMDGRIKQPAEYKAKVQFLLGKKDGASYWFAEIGAGTSGQDPDGAAVPAGSRKKLKKVAMTKTGLKVGPLEITGITGRIYHHMRPQTAVGVDCNMDFDQIDEPGLKEYNLNLEIPDLPDVDICSILNSLNAEQVKKLLCGLNKRAFGAVLEKFPEPDFDQIQSYLAEKGPSDSKFLNQMIAAEARAHIEEGYEDNVKEKYHSFTYAQLAKVFPGYDWCQKVIDDNDQGIQWGDLLCQMPAFQWPSVPDLCDLSEYLFNRVLEALPPPGYGDLEAVMYDKDWSGIKVEHPSITWPEIRDIFPDENLCRILMVFPHIDWGRIYLKIPQLPKLEWPDWRLHLPDLPDLNLNLPDIDINLPELSFKPGEIDVDYAVDPSVSYGNYLLVDYQDFAKKGEVVQGTGTMEINFSSSGSLKNIGLQVTSNWGNYPGNAPVIEGLGCMTYNPSKGQFIGDFFGQSRNAAICGHGKLHVDISDKTFHVNLASKEKPVVVQPLCAQGPVRLTGYFSLNPNVFNVGLGAYVRYGFKGSISSDVCDLGIKAEASLRADIFASVQYRPEVAINEASFYVAFNASLDVTTGGSLCSFGDFNVAEVGLSGNLKYVNATRMISGEVSGHARFLSIISCDFDLSTEYKL
ncbi:MAG TPA: hypothetical protein VE912_00395, partial [Bacteroidales bacterium]|nr:hypothetical protein [Bacteroidales bacterium]